MQVEYISTGRPCHRRGFRSPKEGHHADEGEKSSTPAVSKEESVPVDPERLEVRILANADRSFAVTEGNYPLRYSVILDPATTISITNTEARLVNYRQAADHDSCVQGIGSYLFMGTVR